MLRPCCVERFVILRNSLKLLGAVGNTAQHENGERTKPIERSIIIAISATFERHISSLLTRFFASMSENGPMPRGFYGAAQSPGLGCFGGISGAMESDPRNPVLFQGREA